MNINKVQTKYKKKAFWGSPFHFFLIAAHQLSVMALQQPSLSPPCCHFLHTSSCFASTPLCGSASNLDEFAAQWAISMMFNIVQSNDTLSHLQLCSSDQFYLDATQFACFLIIPVTWHLLQDHLTAVPFDIRFAVCPPFQSIHGKKSKANL